jgi:hypothetical protein
MASLSTLFLNQAVFIWISIEQGMSFWFIFPIVFFYSNAVNFAFFYGTEMIEKIWKIIRRKKKGKRRRKFYVICYIAVKRWERKIRKITCFSIPFFHLVKVAKRILKWFHKTQESCYTTIKRWSKKLRWLPLIIYFFMPFIPLFGPKEACIIIAEELGFKFYVLVIITIAQIILIYLLKPLLW